MPTSSQDEPYIPHYNSSLKGLTSEITHTLKRKELRLLNRLEPMLSRISPSPQSTKPLSLCCSQLSAFGRVDPSSWPTTVTPTLQGYQGTAMYWPVGPACKAAGFSSCHGTSKDFSSCSERAWCHEFPDIPSQTLPPGEPGMRFQWRPNLEKGTQPRQWQGAR